MKTSDSVRGGIYRVVSLPEQKVVEITNTGMRKQVDDAETVRRERPGVEMHGTRYAVVISSQEFNHGQDRGLIIISATGARVNGEEKFKTPQPTWVRITLDGEPGWVLCEQVRYADAGRCGKFVGALKDHELKSVVDKLRKLLMLP